MDKISGIWKDKIEPEPNLEYLLFFKKEGVFTTVVAKYDFQLNRWISTDNMNHHISNSIVSSISKIEYPNIVSTGV